ncbi:MAG: MCE family protein [Planctomycetes bacterium]|nr:MCE family protein [Planctomycetota bacterium]
MSKQTRLEITIGVFAIAAVLVVAGMILAFGGGANLFAKTYDVNIKFKHVGDLLAGAPVKLGGVKVGFIKDISLLEDGHVQAIAAIAISEGPGAIKLKEGTTAFINVSGIVGDTFVELVPGDGEKDLQDIENPEIIESGGNMMQNMQTASAMAIDTIANVKIAINNLNDIIGDKDFKKNIHATVANTVKIAEKAEAIMTDLKGTTENIRALASDENLATVNEILENVKKSSDDVTTISSDLSSIFARTDKLFEDKEPALRSSLDNVSAITADIRDKLAAVDPEKGLMRYLTTNEFNQRFDAIMDQLTGITTSLGDMVQGTTKLELMKAYIGGRRMWAIEEKELRRMRLDGAVEMENEIWRRDREKVAQRMAIIAAEEKKEKE